jgi:hypothetical protein
MSTDLNPAIPSYEVLIAALEQCEQRWKSLSIRVEQLHETLGVIRDEADEKDARRISVLADIGIEVAEKTAEQIDVAVADAVLVGSSAARAIPLRAWRESGSGQPSDDDLRTEEEFAKAVTEFPRYECGDAEGLRWCITKGDE